MCCSCRCWNSFEAPCWYFLSYLINYYMQTYMRVELMYHNGISAVAICCCLAESKYVLLDPDKLEEQKMKAFVYLVFPNSPHSALPKESLQVGGEPMECGIITSVTHGKLEVDDYLLCLNRGRAASAKLSEYLRRSLQSQLTSEPSNF
nr:exosome complex exonuclease RRP46 homolog [Ipomoea batatas]